MSDRRTAAALFVLAFGVYVYFYGGWGANQEVNYALTRAIVEARTLQVDHFTVREGDIATGADRHIYINKPPGLSWLGVVPYTFQYAAQRKRLITFRDYWRTNKQLVTIAVCGLTGALIPVVLFLYGRRALGVTQWTAALVAIAISLGTILLPYSVMLFAHVPAAFFLLLSFVLLRDRPLLAGAAAGISGACFLLSAVAAALILVPLAWLYSARKAALFIAGGVPFAVALAVYQWICFGSPFVTPLERSGQFTEQGLLLGVFGRPDPSRLWQLTFSEYRGLFYTSPVLLLTLAGMVVMLRQRRVRAELLAVGAITIVFVLSNICFNGWHGGAAFGPRYLLPVIPLLAIPMMFVADRWRWLWLSAVALSITINLVATAVDPMPLDGLERPLTGYIIPTLRGQALPEKTRTWVYPGCNTPRCTDKQVSLPPDSGNLGEYVLGKGRAWTVLPALLWIIVGSAVILVMSYRSHKSYGSHQSYDPDPL
jgi:hypothetical protein